MSSTPKLMKGGDHIELIHQIICLASQFNVLRLIFPTTTGCPCNHTKSETLFILNFFHRLRNAKIVDQVQE